MRFVGIALLAMLIFLPCSRAVAGDKYSVQKQFKLGGPGLWDYLVVDSIANRLFISRENRVLVLSTVNDSQVAVIPNTPGVHGIALAPELGKGFTSNGGANTITVFDLTSLKTLTTIPVGGQNPDAIVYDAPSTHVFTFNHQSADASSIDPVSGKVVSVIPLPGKPEFAVSDGTGRLFVNIEDKALIVTIDALHGKLIASWSLPGCDEPTGLALDSAHHRLFSVCGNAVMVVTDADSGKNVARVAIGKGADATIFDSGRNLVFSSNGEDGTLTVIHQDDPNRYSVVSEIRTKLNARTMALDARTHRIYLVAAELVAAPTPKPKSRPQLVDGTFEVIVVGDR